MLCEGGGSARFRDNGWQGEEKVPLARLPSAVPRRVRYACDTSPPQRCSARTNFLNSLSTLNSILLSPTHPQTHPRPNSHILTSASGDPPAMDPPTRHDIPAPSRDAPCPPAPVQTPEPTTTVSTEAGNNSSPSTMSVPTSSPTPPHTEGAAPTITSPTPGPVQTGYTSISPPASSQALETPFQASPINLERHGPASQVPFSSDAPEPGTTYELTVSPSHLRSEADFRISPSSLEGLPE
jgi:hypothetical protein